MTDLVASILSSSLIFVVFRIARDYACRLPVLITVNYLAAFLLGLFLFGPVNQSIFQAAETLFPYAALLGVLFIAMFFLIGQSSQKAGISITTLATKLSLVFPVVFSLLFFNEKLSPLKIVGIITAFTAVALSVYKKDISKSGRKLIVLPLVIFIGSGMVDSLVKFVQAEKISRADEGLYTTMVFGVALVVGFFYLLFKKEIKAKIHFPTLILGVLLGVVNFGSLYFIIRALNNSGLESSLVFSLNNMSIVAFTTLLGTLFFKEKLNKINFAGIALALVSLHFLL